jgi:hypothetical protein
MTLTTGGFDPQHKRYHKAGLPFYDDEIRLTQSYSLCTLGVLFCVSNISRPNRPTEFEFSCRRASGHTPRSSRRSSRTSLGVSSRARALTLMLAAHRVAVDLNSFLAALNIRPYLVQGINETTATTPPTSLVFARFESMSSLRGRRTKVRRMKGLNDSTLADHASPTFRVGMPRRLLVRSTRPRRVLAKAMNRKRPR